MNRVLTTPWRAVVAHLPDGLIVALVISQLAALGWWYAAVRIRGADIIPVWYDQQVTFTQTVHHLDNPYRIPNFANPPWTAALLVPFSLMSLPVAVLVQLCLYFAILTGVVFKFGGGRAAAIIAVTSFPGFISALELNVDWLVCLGLLLPRVWSGPLIVIKPQLALGYFASFSRREFIRSMAVLLAVGVIALAVWGLWPLAMRDEAQRIVGRASYNLAPSELLPLPVSWGIGLAAGWIAFKRRDPVLCILAWLFFTPYIAFYSLLLPLALLAARWPRFALLISAVVWIVYGGAVLPGIILRL